MTNVIAKQYAQALFSLAQEQQQLDNMYQDLQLLLKQMDSEASFYLFMKHPNITKNDKNEVEMIDYNTEKVNLLLKKINQSIYSKLYNLEEGNINQLFLSSSLTGIDYRFIDSGIVCEIPLGSLSGNGFLANLGPIIPVKMSFLGQVSSNLKTKVTSYGINNLLLEIYIHVEIKEKISLPKSSEVATVKIDAPLSLKIISGVVPNYYGGIIDKSSQTTFFPVN